MFEDCLNPKHVTVNFQRSVITSVQMFNSYTPNGRHIGFLLFTCKLALVAQNSTEHFSINEATGTNLRVDERILKWRPFWNKVEQNWNICKWRAYSISTIENGSHINITAIFTLLYRTPLTLPNKEKCLEGNFAMSLIKTHS